MDKYTAHDVIDLPLRFQQKIVVSPNDIWSTPCWMWTAKLGGNGYGRAWWEGREQPAHRAVWLALGLPYDPSLEFDHLCDVNACCAPHHLEMVTTRANNIRRGLRVTACPAGHDYTLENTLVSATKHGIGRQKQCRECMRRRHRAWSKKQTAKKELVHA